MDVFGKAMRRIEEDILESKRKVMEMDVKNDFQGVSVEVRLRII